MKTVRVVVVVLFVLAYATGKGQNFLDAHKVASDLVIPWEIEVGHDGFLWTTERIGIFSKINPATGEKHVLLDVQDSTFPSAETGMLGFDFHPEFPDSPFVYIANCYGTNKPLYRVVNRYTYDTVSFEHDTLIEPFEIYRKEPIEWSHQGCRIKFGPDGKLYFTSGEGGVHKDSAQDLTSDLGKLLRINSDGSIPHNNPFPESRVWSYGHRNQQGLVFLPNGLCFTSEHGDVIEDEVNLIFKGGNYGWPFVEGPCDTDSEKEFCDTTVHIPPTYSSGPEQTTAMCGLDYYNHDRIPRLKNSLLLATLRGSAVWQLRLNEANNIVVEDLQLLPNAIGRIRDFAISDDGRVYVISSNASAGAVDPFPREGDDHIYELVPFNTTLESTIDCVDTVYIGGTPGTTTFFPIELRNTGTVPTKLLDIERVITDGPIDDAQWVMPIVILPGENYPVAHRFFPWEVGKNVGRMRFVTDNAGSRDVVIIGTASPVSVQTFDPTTHVSVSPNPSISTVLFKAPEGEQIESITIFNVQGETVYHGSFGNSSGFVWNGQTNDGSLSPAGVYSVCLSTRKRIFCTTFVRSE